MSPFERTKNYIKQKGEKKKEEERRPIHICLVKVCVCASAPSRPSKRFCCKAYLHIDSDGNLVPSAITPKLGESLLETHMRISIYKAERGLEQNSLTSE